MRRQQRARGMRRRREDLSQVRPCEFRVMSGGRSRGAGVCAPSFSSTSTDRSSRLPPARYQEAVREPAASATPNSAAGRSWTSWCSEKNKKLVAAKLGAAGDKKLGRDMA